MTVMGEDQATIYRNQQALRDKLATAGKVGSDQVLFYNQSSNTDPRTGVQTLSVRFFYLFIASCFFRDDDDRGVLFCGRTRQQLLCACVPPPKTHTHTHTHTNTPTHPTHPTHAHNKQHPKKPTNS